MARRVGHRLLVVLGALALAGIPARTGGGRSAIVYWNNEGAGESPIAGAFTARDTAIMDPPTWVHRRPGLVDR